MKLNVTNFGLNVECPPKMSQSWNNPFHGPYKSLEIDFNFGTFSSINLLNPTVNHVQHGVHYIVNCH